MSKEAEKTFCPAVLGSITSGTLLVDDFGKVHEAIEWIVGHPVWTHELPRKAGACSAAITALYPDMPTEHPSDLEACITELRTRYGEALPIARGSQNRTESPVASLVGMLGGSSS